MLQKLSMLNSLRWSTESSKTMRVAKESGLILGGSLFIALMSQLSIFLPFTPVPLTGQTFAIMLISVFFGGKRALLTVSAYLTEGVCGLPVFSSGGFGLMHLLGPSGGYLIGFLFASYLIGTLSEKGFNKNFWSMILMMIVAHLIIYTCGLINLTRFFAMNQVLNMGLIPFLAGDAIKVMTLSILIPMSKKFVK